MAREQRALYGTRYCTCSLIKCHAVCVAHMAREIWRVLENESIVVPTVIVILVKKRHKELYFDNESGQWIQSEHAGGNDSEEFEDIGESESLPEVRSYGADTDEPPMIDFTDSGDVAPDPALEYGMYYYDLHNNVHIVYVYVL